MVRKKKSRSTSEDEGTTEEVATEEPIMAVGATLEEPIETPVEEPVVEEPQVKLLSYEETLQKLLDDRPPVPHFTRWEDVPAWVDRYARWDRDVKGAKR